MNAQLLKSEIEGGENMRDIAELHASELGGIIWQHKSHQSPEHIAKRLRVKLWQVKRYIKEVSSANVKGDSQSPDQ